MKKTGLLAALLALSLLAGCSGGPGGDLVADPDDLAYQAADIRRDRELVTVDGKPITAERYLFWLVNAIETARQYGMLPDDAAWTDILGDGMTMTEALKADALETAKLYRVVETKAEELGVTLTQEQEEELQTQMAQAIESMGGEEAFQTHLDEMCVSRECFFEMNRIYYLNQGIKEKLEESGALTVTQEDKDRYAEEIMAEGGLYAAKHILLSTRKTNADGSYEEMSDEERTAVKTRAEELRQQLRDGGDSEALFDQLMIEFSEDGRDADGKLYAPNGYGLVYSGQMVPEFENGALALKEGEVSEPIATAYGYHIIMRIPLDQEQFNELVESASTSDAKLQDLVEQWLEQAKVVTTKAYDELDPKTFSERLTAINEAKAAAKESEAPAESAAESEAPAESAAN